MSSKSVLILGILLLVPIFAFLFLEVFGTNQYALKTYFPVLDENTELPVVRNGDTVFQRIPDFRLTSQAGKEVTSQDLKNQVYVANFIFTSCKDVCKKMTHQMTRVQEAFQKESRVKLVSFSVDPERDSVASLNKYARQYGADANKWYFLTGPKVQIYSLAREGYKLAAMQAPTVNPDFIHSEKFVLVDDQQHVRGIYDGTSEEDVDRLITEIKILLDERARLKK